MELISWCLHVLQSCFPSSDEVMSRAKRFLEKNIHNLVHHYAAERTALSSGRMPAGIRIAEWKKTPCPR